MNKKAQANIIGPIIAIIFAVIGLAITFSVISVGTNTADASDTIAWGANGTSISLSYDDLNSITSVVNGSIVLNESAQYISDLPGGTLQLIDNSYNNTAAVVTYNYDPDGYIDNTLTRIIIGFLGVFWALGCLSLAGKLAQNS